MSDLFSEIKYWTNLFIGLISILLNITLYFLIKKKSSNNLKNYKKVLYLGCLMDLLNSIFNFLLDPDVTTLNGIYFIFSRGILGYLPTPLSTWAQPIAMFFIYFGLINVLIQFIFRYLHICWNIILSKFAFLVLVMIGINLVASNCIMYYIYFINRTVKDEDFIKFLRGTEYEINGTIPPFGALPSDAFPFALLLAVILVISSYITVIFCGIKIYLKIKQQQGILSQGAKKYQHQISIVMVAEACIPIITLIFPILLDLLPILTESYISWSGKLTFLLCAFVPFLNPIVKLLVISCYRNCILKLFHFQNILSVHFIPSAHPSTP